MILKEWLSDIGQKLAQQGIENASLEAQQMIKETLGYKQADIIAKWSEPFIETEALSQIIARRLNREPLYYILGNTEFYGLPFHVTPDVLIPRSDTEILVEQALGLIEDIQNPMVLDLCTGSGCIPIAIKKNRPDAICTGIDISEAALKIAVENSEVNGCQINWLLGDLFAPITELTNQYDLICSNPPYIKSADIANLAPEIRSFEPMIALDGGDDGLDFYKIIIEKAQSYLKEDGHLILEIGFDQLDSVIQLFETNAYSYIRSIKDYQGFDRVVFAKRGERNV